MGQSAHRDQRLRELFDADLPADELERLAGVDALLRAVADQDRDRDARFADRPSLSLVATTGSSEPGDVDRTYELNLTYGQLDLLSRALQAVKDLGRVPPQDELLNDT